MLGDSYGAGERKEERGGLAGPDQPGRRARHSLTGLVGAGVYAIMRAEAPRWSERDVALFLLSLAAVGMFSTRIGGVIIDDMRAALAFAIGTLAHAVGMLACLIRPALVLGLFVAAIMIIQSHM